MPRSTSDHPTADRAANETSHTITRPRTSNPDWLVEVEALSQRGLDLAGDRRLHEAYTTVREAVRLCRRAPGTDPRMARTLGVGLTNRGLVQAWLGRYTDALRSTDEAVGVLRAQPDLEAVGDNRPALADALDSLGSRYAALGRYPEALEPAWESVRLLRDLVRSDSGHRPRLARALNNLGSRLADLERHQEALETTLEALELYRELYRGDPRHHLAGLVHSLSTLGLRLADLNRSDEVTAPVLEVVDLLSGLEDRHPANRLGELIGSLQWLARYLDRHGHRPAARATTGAVRMVREQLAVG